MEKNWGDTPSATLTIFVEMDLMLFSMYPVILNNAVSYLTNVSETILLIQETCNCFSSVYEKNDRMHHYN